MDWLVRFWKPDPKELARKWKRAITHEIRLLQRTNTSVGRSILEARRDLKAAARRGERDNLPILARAIVQAQHSQTRNHTTIASMESLKRSIDIQVGTIRVTNAMSNVADIMTLMNQLVRVPELQKTMRVLNREMCQASIVDEILGDVVDEDVEVEADSEVAAILAEITQGQLQQSPHVPTPIPTADREIARRLAMLHS